MAHPNRRDSGLRIKHDSRTSSNQKALWPHVAYTDYWRDCAPHHLLWNLRNLHRGYRGLRWTITHPKGSIMALSIAERCKRYRERHPEKYTAEARRDKRRKSDEAYRKTPAYQEAFKKYRITDKCKLTMQNHHLQSEYGITIEDKCKMWEDQKGLCGLCNRALPEQINKCHLDHNHNTGQIRQLLHHRCNMVLGFFEKDPDFITKVFEYLDKYDGA